MNIWHDMNPTQITPPDFCAVIEISKGSRCKYELDKATGMLRLDRVLYTATHYPANYGFIPRTFADDLDPLDVLVICSETIQPMTLVRCYPIGVLRMIDDGHIDDKIITIVISTSFPPICSMRCSISSVCIRSWRTNRRRLSRCMIVHVPRKLSHSRSIDTTKPTSRTPDAPSITEMEGKICCLRLTSGIPAFRLVP